MFNRRKKIIITIKNQKKKIIFSQNIIIIIIIESVRVNYTNTHTYIYIPTRYNIYINPCVNILYKYIFVQFILYYLYMQYL